MASFDEDDNQIYLNDNPQQTEASDDEEEDFLDIHERVFKRMGYQQTKCEQYKQNNFEESPQIDLAANTFKTKALPKRKNMQKNRASTSRLETRINVLDQLLSSKKPQTSICSESEREIAPTAQKSNNPEENGLNPLENEPNDEDIAIETTQIEQIQIDSQPRKRSREEMEGDSNRILSHQRKKKRKLSPFDVDDPFKSFSKWSISHRARSKKKKSTVTEAASVKSQSAIKHKVKREKRKRKRKRTNDPFHIEMPANMSPLCNRRKIRRVDHSNSCQTTTNSSVPQSKQLQRLTRTCDRIQTPSSNHNLFSTLPRTHSPNERRKMRRTENIEEVRITNEDLQGFQSSQRMSHHQNAFSSSLHQRVSSDQREMDASSDENEDANEVMLSTPKWLQNLTKGSKNKRMQNKHNQSNKKKKKQNLNNFGDFQYGLYGLNLKIANRCNMVKTYKDCIHKIPANLGVNEKMTLKILKSMLSLNHKIPRKHFNCLQSADCHFTIWLPQSVRI